MVTEDSFLDGKIKITQQKKGYRFSIDAAILASYANPGKNEKIVDLGTGCGIIPLILSYRYPDVLIWGIEIQETLAKCAISNVNDNGVGDQIKIVLSDMKLVSPKMTGGAADVVISNPPYRKANSGRINPSSEKAVARHEIKITLSELVMTAKRLLRTAGRFVLIYPAERAADLLFELRNNNLEPKMLTCIHSHQDSEAKLILVEAVKAGRPGLTICSPLVIYHTDGDYSAEITRMLEP